MKKLLPFLLHLLLWVLLLTFSLFTHFNVRANQVPVYWLVLDIAQIFLFHLALFYFNWFVLLKILANGNVAGYAVAVLLTLATYSAVRAPIEIYQVRHEARMVPSLAKQLAKHPSMLEFENVMLQLAIIGVMNIFLSSALKVTGDYLRNERRRKELELQQATTELELLKAQVNPHFLFNTLNNIYSLAYQNSNSTADAILKLSLLLRYQLYETNTARVPPAREVEHLHHLLDLHRLRLLDPSQLTLTVQGDLAPVWVPPMLLMPLVENMFKHGLSSGPMHLQLLVESQSLTFTTHNRLKGTAAAPETFGGIGLQNLKRRLELLYPGHHSFSTRQENQDFIASLTLTRLS